MSKTYLEQIWHSRVILEMSLQEIFNSVFQLDVNKISYAYLKTLCSICDGQQQNERFFGPRLERRGGPREKIGVLSKDMFLQIFANTPQTRLKRARETFAIDHYGGVDVPSLSTFSRVLKKAKVTRKVLERSHHLRCPIKRINYMNRCAPFHYSRFVDIDETLSTWKEFLQRHGYAPKGEVALKTQFRINGKHYSSICAYSAVGVLAYRVVEGYIDCLVFQSFLENEVVDGLPPNMICLLDNAAIHHTPMVRGTIHNVFNGMYLYAAPYSPDLKPVERLFAEVKDILREMEDEAVLDPIGCISRIFDMFRPGNVKALMARNHFRLYRDNHNQYRVRMHLV